MAGQGPTPPADGEGLPGMDKEGRRGAGDVCGRGDQWAWMKGAGCQVMPAYLKGTESARAHHPYQPVFGAPW